MAKKEADALAPASHMHPFARQSIKRTLEIRFASCVWTEPHAYGPNPDFRVCSPCQSQVSLLCAYLMTAVTIILQIIQKFCAIKSEKAVLTGTIVSTLSEIKRPRAGELPVQIQILKHLIQSVVVRMRRHHVGDVL